MSLWKRIDKMPRDGWVHFTGTQHEEEFDWEDFFNETKEVTYVCAGWEEAPTTGKMHWQWYAYQKGHPRKNIDVYRMHGMHAEACKCAGASWEYAKKCGKFVEYGTPPGTGQGRRRDIEYFREEVKRGATELEIWEQNASMGAQYGRRLEHYRNLLQPKRTWKTEMKIFWGPPGTGKTTAAVEWLGADYDVVSMHNGFMIGYKNNPNVLIDDLDHETMRRDVFLQLGDRFPCVVNVKNSEMQWNAKRLAITSNYDPKLWFADDGEAVRRRCDEVVHLTSEVAISNTSE